MRTDRGNRGNRTNIERLGPPDDTIVAISTPPGRSGVGVIRLSGADSRAIAAQFIRPRPSWAERRAALGNWCDAAGEPVDAVLTTFFRAPRSYTGEDVVEISAHGNPYILSRIVELAQTAGARIADPGEFTLRAVLRGKMDLVQAEAVGAFIDAQTQAQARLALRQMDGSTSRVVRPIKDRLLDLIAQVEAGIDFADDDIEPPDTVAAGRQLRTLAAELAELQRTYAYGKHLTCGVRVAIAGKPNVGKSSLFNKLIAEERAIVTDLPGTTRDVLAESIDFEGVPLRLFDTAGIRDATDRVEAMGVAKALETVVEADFVLAVFDGSEAMGVEDRGVLAKTAGIPRLVVINKSDLPEKIVLPDVDPKVVVRLSARTGEGFERLREALRYGLRECSSEALSETILSTARQNDAVGSAMESVRSGADAIVAGVPEEMVLLHLYAALGALNELTGEVVTEDILGRIFSTFCVGK